MSEAGLIEPESNWREWSRQIGKRQMELKASGVEQGEARKMAANEVGGQWNPPITGAALMSLIGRAAQRHQMKTKPEVKPEAQASCATANNAGRMLKASLRELMESCANDFDFLPPDPVVARLTGYSVTRPGQIRQELEQAGYKFERSAIGCWLVSAKPEPERTYTKAEVQELLKQAKREALRAALESLA